MSMMVKIAAHRWENSGEADSGEVCGWSKDSLISASFISDYSESSGNSSDFDSSDSCLLDTDLRVVHNGQKTRTFLIDSDKIEQEPITL